MNRSVAWPVVRSRALPAWVMALSIVAVASWTRPVAAQSAPVVRPEAQPHLDRGLALYRERSFTAAAAEFARAYKLDANRDVLYVWAQALRLSGDCVKAATLYEQFLAADPPKGEADLARANLGRCQSDGSLPAPSAGASGVPPGATDTVGATAAPPPLPDDHRPPLARVQALPQESPTGGGHLAEGRLEGGLLAPPRVGWTLLERALVGGGTVAVALGGAFYLSARSERDAAREATTYGAVQEHAASAQARERLAWGAVAVGTTLVAAGIIHYLLTR